MRASAFVLAASLICAVGAYATPFPGPDAFGYVGTGITPNLRNISGTGTVLDLSGNAANTMSPAFSIGFQFNFYGTNYSSFYVSSNGFLTFLPGQSDGCCDGQSFPTAGDPDAVVAAFWTDLVPGPVGDVFYETTGPAGSQELVVGFYDVSHWSGGLNSTFEMILHEGSNSIELQYGMLSDQTFNLSSAGIENQDGAIGLELFLGVNPGPVIGDKGFLIAYPIPEPATLSFVALGLAGLLAWRRRRSA